MPECWCTVTVTTADGRRHSLDVLASSTYDAAHLYVTHAKAQPQLGLPIPSLATVFEVVHSGMVYTVEGSAGRIGIEQGTRDELMNHRIIRLPLSEVSQDSRLLLRAVRLAVCVGKAQIRIRFIGGPQQQVAQYFDAHPVFSCEGSRRIASRRWPMASSRWPALS